MDGAALRQKIRAEVEKPTMRVDGGPPDAIVTTPRPRVALRVGLTGHRSGRLLKAARKAGMTPDEHDLWLQGQIDRVFVAIQDAAAVARKTHCYERAGERRFFYDQDALPIIRLVSGLALGADIAAVDLVARRFRGTALPSGRTSQIPENAVADRRFENGQAEWRIDAIAPFSMADFVNESARDYVERYADLADDVLADRFVTHWREALQLPNTSLTLQAGWRVTTVDAAAAAQDADEEEKARRSAMLAAAAAPRLQDVCGPAETPPARPEGLKPCERLTLDYKRAGDFMLRQIDVLVAIWDGGAAQGVGGAPDIVATALDLGLPIVCIDPGDTQAPPRMVLRVERATGEAIVNWASLPLSRDMSPVDACKGALRDQIVDLLEPPSERAAEPHDAESERTERQRAIDFLEEEWPRRDQPKIYTAFSELVRLETPLAPIRFLLTMTEPPGSVKADRPPGSVRVWTSLLNGDPDQGEQSILLKKILHRRYVVADLLSIQYADQYRGAFVKAYLWAAAATLIAIVGFVLPHEAWLPTVKDALLLLELYVVAKIVQKVRAGRTNAWHEKFLHYRGLAESLRHLRLLASFGEYPEAGKAARAGESAWWVWYLRATARELGLPRGELDGNYQRGLLSAVRRFEVQGQIAYHERTAAREEATDHAIHTWGKVLFWTTLAVLAGALFVYAGAFVSALWMVAPDFPVLSEFPVLLHDHAPAWFPWFEEHVKPWVSLLAAVLPSVGAALEGIRFTADFSSKAKRSLNAAKDLERIEGELLAGMERPEFDRTRKLLIEVSGIMAEDLGAFLSLYGRKPLTLPG